MSNSPQLVVALPKVTYYFWLSICIQKLTVGVEGLLVLKVDLVFGDILKKIVTKMNFSYLLIRNHVKFSHG